MKENTKDFTGEAEIASLKMTQVKENEDISEDSTKNVDKVCIPYGIFNLSYKNHSYCKTQPHHALLSYPFRNTAAHTEAMPTREGI